jgi:hypothetical protein
MWPRSVDRRCALSPRVCISVSTNSALSRRKACATHTPHTPHTGALTERAPAERRGSPSLVMGSMSCRKGAAGERELIGLLRDRLGDLPGLCRNLDQCRSGGADFHIADHAVEVKRAERFRAVWIEQAKRQAGNAVPVIAWRRSGDHWQFLLVMDLEEFTGTVREALGSTAVSGGCVP